MVSFRDVLLPMLPGSVCPALTPDETADRMLFLPFQNHDIARTRGEHGESGGQQSESGAQHADRETSLPLCTDGGQPQDQSAPADDSVVSISRRDVLGTVCLGAAGVAGCLGNDGDDTSGDGSDDGDNDTGDTSGNDSDDSDDGPDNGDDSDDGSDNGDDSDDGSDNGDDSDDGSDNGDDSDDGSDNGDDSDDGSDNGDDSGESEEETLRYALAGQVDTFDPPFSDSAQDSIVFNNVYEGLVTTGRDGALYNWHAAASEIVDVQDVGFEDYEPYMEKVPFDDNGQAAPEDRQVVGGGRFEDAEEGIALTLSGARDAAADGVYGVHIKYELHEGIEFHNAEELTAQHYVNSLERYTNSEVSEQVFNGTLAYLAAGEHTLDVYGVTPNAEAQRELPISVFADKQVDLPDGDLDPREGNTPMGTGPYELVDYGDGSFWEFETFDSYWMEAVGVENKSWGDGLEDVPDSPNPDTLELGVIPDSGARTGLLESHEFDMTHNLSVDQRNTLDSADGITVESTDATGYTFFQLPAEAPGPWQEAEVRRAFNNSIPRSQVVDVVRDGWAEEALVPIPRPAAGEVIDDYDSYAETVCAPLMDQGIDWAAELLSEADAELPVSCTVVTNSDDNERLSVAETVVQVLNDSGLWDLTLDTEPDLNTLIQRFQTGDSFENEEMTLLGLDGGFDPYSYAFALHSPDVYPGCCQWMNFGVNSGLDVTAITDPLQETSSLEAVADPQYRASLFQNDVIPAVLEQAGNCIVDYAAQTVVVNSRAISDAGAHPRPGRLLSYNLYAPYDEVAVEIDRNGESGDDNGGDTTPEEAVDSYLTDNSASGYDGPDSIEDLTGEDSVTIEAGSNSYTRFAPVAARIDSGATVTWEWASSGHSVEQTDSNLDFEYAPIQAEGYTHQWTFDESGVFLYRCGPHAAQGEHGALIIE